MVLSVQISFIICLKMDLQVKVINLDKMTYAGNKENLNFIENDDKYYFIEG